jgi:hypothetical protein
VPQPQPAHLPGGIVIARFLEDFPTDLIPISETRECAKCGAFTWWAGPRQRTKGKCISCAPKFYASEELHDKVIWDVAGAFPGTEVVEEEVRLWRAGTYEGDGAGPCALCRGQIKRYGEGGMPLCLACFELRGMT